eukprot:6526551-Heterocapsa_arctica.AAC.1
MDPTALCPRRLPMAYSSLSGLLSGLSHTRVGLPHVLARLRTAHSHAQPQALLQLRPSWAPLPLSRPGASGSRGVGPYRS